jgi:hypothetical protein
LGRNDLLPAPRHCSLPLCTTHQHGSQLRIHVFAQVLWGEWNHRENTYITALSQQLGGIGQQHPDEKGHFTHCCDEQSNEDTDEQGSRRG